ncbi:peptide-N(4)-(N-acetyl-beta-glucosaminyl)asparagine amidase [Selaginella moellendorffii]|uniref:peptide-N(4)-(N-acetyl-beta- glucosaminyl)asparagine amidase n=1 Tax=Selaginella moellendorffii TaxID=88036 RepID=UPI000D1C4C34|nr:peptide-N(4)-(N-acetyl-beta-glucosaminyl)asparagine amidase [Selaginella moellendorffii]|eukprot:XP_024533630.1 peptide-N(4)-(N-acetyl-beta-glucosaminyl)asparagine amidase [Selaginella moellendorffii]
MTYLELPVAVLDHSLENQVAIGIVLHSDMARQQNFAGGHGPYVELVNSQDVGMSELEGEKNGSLLLWWVNSTSFDFCASNTHHIGMGGPSAEDLQFGASRVEIHRCFQLKVSSIYKRFNSSPCSCELCGTVTRFPRYNSPAKVLDFTDHVWTEFHSPYLGSSFSHANTGLASRWGKKLNYVIPLRKMEFMMLQNDTHGSGQRNLVSEETAEEVVALLTAIQRSKLEPEELDILEQRDRQEAEELSGAQASPETDQHLPGRQSGSKEWREARGEMGVQHIESDHSFCPARLCADEHVGKIYQAIGLLCSQERSTAEKEQALLHDLLIKLKRQPFRARSAKLESTDETQLNFLQSKGGAAWLDGIGMKQASDGSGGMQRNVQERLLWLLPQLLRTSRKPRRSSHPTLQLMLQGRRLCGGSVYATGEQKPSGTASAAFEGHYSTKWEEPEGAKGCSREAAMGVRPGNSLTSEVESYFKNATRDDAL